MSNFCQVKIARLRNLMEYFVDTVAQRLDIAVKIGGFKSRKKMCESLEIPYSSMNTWITRDSIPANGIMKITSKIQISRTYLETGTGDPLLGEDTGLSNYGYDDRVEEMVKMYNDMDDVDRRAIYHVMRKMWQSKDGVTGPSDDDLKFD